MFDRFRHLMILGMTLCLTASVPAAHIIWVNEGAAGDFDTWKTFLEGAGHTVTQMSDMRTLDQGKIDAMNAADLVIVSRDTDSGNYDDGDEIAQWNGLTVPLMQQSSYLIRNNRWLWVDNADTPSIGATDELVIVEDHFIFKGIASAGDSLPMVETSTSFTGPADGGNGQVLGTLSDGRLWIVYWDAGTEFYSGSGQIPAGPRMWFAAGSSNKSGENLNAEGEQILLNAITFLTGGASSGSATSPNPEDGASDVVRDGLLTWTPGLAGQKHNVFFGETLQDVNSATAATAAGLDVNSFDPGALEFGQTYYWRVDEVNATPDRTVFKGNIWSFQVEPYSVMIPVDVNNVTASSFSPFNPPEMTVNGSGLDGMTHSTAPETMWLSNSPDLDPWLVFEFDQTEKLHRMLVWNSNSTSEAFVGWGIKDVNIEYSLDGVEWTTLADVPQIARASGLPTYNEPQAVDLGLVLAKYVKINILNSWGGLLPQFGLAEVQFYALPTRPRIPNPAIAAQGVDPRSDRLAWRAGREAGQHDVYVSEDPDALGSPQTVKDSKLALSGLNLALDTTYYWQVDEVNEAQVPSTWTGDLWNFTTVDSFVVDDFESYNNLSPDRPFQHWLDGYGYSADDYFPVTYKGNGTGAGIGHDIWNPSSPYFAGDLMETGSTLPGSGQSLPFYYKNTGGVASETLHKFPAPQDWTVNGLQTLSIAFRGTGGNTGTLYAKINSVKIPYDLAATDIGLAAWQVWNIDLTQVSGLKNVTSLSIGVDGSAASGMILIDDIKLYAKPGELITPVAPDTAGLLAQYSFEGNANDISGHGLNGSLTPILATIAAPGASGQGSSVQLQLGGYVDLGNPSALNFGTGDWTIAAWFKTGMAGTGDANKGTILGKGGDSTGGHRYALIMSETYEGMVTLVTDDNVTKVVVDSSTPTNDDQWHFVAGQRHGTELRIYIDGQLENSNSADLAYDLSGTSQHNAYVGAVTNNASGTLYKMFNGAIDNVALYNRALSAEEILWLAGRTTPIHKPF